MKKRLVIWLFIFLMGFLIACQANLTNLNKQNNDRDSRNFDDTSQNDRINKKEHDQKDHDDPKSDKEQEPDFQPLDINDYYPMRANTRYVYEGSGNEYASYEIFNDFIVKGKIQHRVNNGGTVLAKVIELRDGKLTEVYSREEAYYRENLLEAGASQGDGEILLMEPLTKGTTWTLKDSRVRTITNTDVEITTPMGIYHAIEVTTTTKGNHEKTIDYYAENVGVVKSIYISGDTEISSILSKIEENVPFIQTIKFYYPNVHDGKIYYESRKVSYHTNDITRKVLAQVYKKVIDPKVAVVFSANTEINSLYLNNDQNVYVDLNQAFVNEMVAGSGVEAMILQSVVNTFGQYYHTDKVYLTINQGLYESGHITLEKGQFLEVEQDR